MPQGFPGMTYGAAFLSERVCIRSPEGSLKDFIFFIRYGVRPRSVSAEIFQLFRGISERLSQIARMPIQQT